MQCYTSPRQSVCQFARSVLVKEGNVCFATAANSCLRSAATDLHCVKIKLLIGHVLKKKNKTKKKTITPQ